MPFGYAACIPLTGLTGRLSLCISPETKRGKGDAPRLHQIGGGLLTQMLQLGAFGEQMVVHENACSAAPRPPLAVA